MNKQNGYRKLGRTSSQRKALLRNQASELIKNGELVTTVEKAKELRRVTEKMITLGKKGDLAARRRAASYVRNLKVDNETNLVQYLFTDIAKKYESRNGGYTRITKLGTRRGDNAELAKIELV